MGQAMVDVIIDERAFGASDRLFDGVKLLRYIDARAACLDHLDDTAKMTVGAFQAFDDGRVTGMGMMTHVPLIPRCEMHVE